MDFMERALQVAGRARGWSSPNPAVGAVIVAQDEVVGEGWTQPPGGPHAEVMALAQAGDRARGGKLYVTLEPCAHFGRTPPCTEALIAAGIAEVHIGTGDPSPWVAGKGMDALRAAGIGVRVGTHAVEARRLHEAYFKWVATKQPFVDLKYAMTADGKIATRTGSSQWVTGTEARGYVATLRGQADAVAVGIGTVFADDPLLTARPHEFGVDMFEPVHQPLRIVFDSRARLPLTAKIVAEAPERTLVLATAHASVEKVKVLQHAGVEVQILADFAGRVSIEAALQLLGERGVTSVLAECGGVLAGSLLEAGAVDRVHVFISPKLVGGRDARGPIEGEGKAEMSEAWRLVGTKWSTLGDDLLLTGYLSGDDGQEALEGPGVFGDH